MTKEEELNYVCEVLAQEIDCKTPDTEVTSEVNRKLAREYVLENAKEVEEAVENSRLPDGDLNPHGLTKRLLNGYLGHLSSRVREEFVVLDD